MVDIVMELLHAVGFFLFVFLSFFKGDIETDFKVLSAGVWWVVVFLWVYVL